MDKDAVSALSTPELASFPLDDFFDHYEKGLRKVIPLLAGMHTLVGPELNAAWIVSLGSGGSWLIAYSLGAVGRRESCTWLWWCVLHQ